MIFIMNIHIMSVIIIIIITTIIIITIMVRSERDLCSCEVT